jgi:malto-oligosyltrehalose synthase/4-alpha-glucanotransferase
MFNPVATYRIQLHHAFTFHDLDHIVPYLQLLGVSTVYVSPVCEAVPGSMHGYDVLDPLRIDPETGNEEQLTALSKRLKEQGMVWLQYIVPNHMAFHPGNAWLMDVLEKGPQSVYASFFDIAWTDPFFKGRVMVPFLDNTLEEVIKKNELNVKYENQRLVLKYGDAAYPLNPHSYFTVLQAKEKGVPESIKQLLLQMAQIKQVEDAKQYTESWNEFRLQLAGIMKHQRTRTFIEKCLEIFNNDPARLQQLADAQSYRLCHWQETDKQINFRRFFTVNGLICLNIQNKEVFRQYHQYLKTLLEQGVFQGLRIDHIDGLCNPGAYLDQLRQLSGEETYMVVEKILQPEEKMPVSWPVQGNTGYDFLYLANNLFTQKSSEEIFTQFYENLSDEEASVQQQLRNQKAYILFQHMGGELENLFRLFKELNLVEKKAFASIRQEDLKNAIGEFLIQCPVYRYYGSYFPLESEEEAAVQNILHRVRRSDSDLSAAVSLLENVLLHQPHQNSEEYNSRVLQFYQRCMQFTGPLMAKGVEDTFMYTYNRFIGHNEVGGTPAEVFGITTEEFHQQMQERQERLPLSLNATATHDTKRGEDARARLNVLTDMPGEWLQVVQEWQSLNAGLKQNRAPDDNDEYFIYQTLVATYPMPEEKEDDYPNRLQQYMQKALREAKRHSNWTTPNEKYEAATQSFITALPDKEKPFWKSFRNFHQQIADYGIVNSLAQVVLKFTCPGTPDVYQGCELWDFSFVDPDNRRPVNYEQRRQWLESFEEKSNDPEKLLQELWKNRHDGKIKLWLVQALFKLRRQHPEFFAQAQYIPLKAEGRYRNNIFAFARQYRHTLHVVAIPLHVAQLCKNQEKEITELDWKDTRIILPEGATSEWEYLLLKIKKTEKRSLPVKNIFNLLPVAILKGKKAGNERGAGILLHLTSLPSPFGVGDMGPEAIAFANFLSRSKQKFWQLLPLNPTEAGEGHSPYSATSGMAGNPLLISPELLVKEGLLNTEDVQEKILPSENQADYEKAGRVKEELFQTAYNNFCKNKESRLHQEFEQFCEQEAYWLNDFALYMLLKKQHEGKPWFQWPEPYKLRNTEALELLVLQYAAELDKVKWLQFIFDRQYKELKAYCNERNIKLLGDLPFYVSYDSVDVWSHPDIFCLDEQGNMTGVAGVPPDAFSDDGQLWGMPVYRWDVLKERGYNWWVTRLRRNQELFDLVRLDHFRAFADYWEVPAGETTAKNGQWKPGPGADFFLTMEAELKELPFVAEDLGEINDAVFRLRDQFHLPGMKVLQFAFDDDMPHSEYIPHNYTSNFIAYTGTHDNNTVLGWFRKDADKEQRKLLEQYAGKPLPEAEVHVVMARIIYGSVAKTAILPIQDVLGLDEKARMNTPASGSNNWKWRLLPGQLTEAAEELLQQWVWLYNRE